METGYECTAYFEGSDGMGTCDTDCQWWFGLCPAAKGSKEWDGQDTRPGAYNIKNDKGELK